MNDRGRIVTASTGGHQASRHTRRRFLGTTVAASLGGFLALSGVLSGPSHSFGRLAFAGEEPGQISADAALKQLMDGNVRYATARQEYPNQSVERRTTVAQGQHPVAIVVSCSDSRVAPELAFDQGLGDLFVVRVAGNVLDDHAIGSIEYGLEELHIPLVMVLGHERCGAVKATLDLSYAGGVAPGHIQSLVKAIQPAVDQAKFQGGDVLNTTVMANIGNTVGQLKTSEPIIHELVHDKKITIVGACYDLDTGEVIIVA